MQIISLLHGKQKDDLWKEWDTYGFLSALQRIGNAYVKLEQLDKAIHSYEKSLTEHRTPDTLQKLRDTQKLQKEREKAAYYNPELADKAREEGNALFKQQNW